MARARIAAPMTKQRARGFGSSDAVKSR